MEEGTLQALGEQKWPRREHGSFSIPNSGSVQIYATGKERTFLMLRGETCLQLSSSCGYWITDFCSVGGYQQALWLPVITVEMPGEWKLHVAKRLLHQILCQCVLTDGVDMLISSDAKVETISTPLGDVCPNIVLCHISVISEHTEPMQLSPPDGGSKQQVESNENGNQSVWMETMTRALETRLIKERKEYEKRVQTQQVQRLLLRKNQMALKGLLNPEGTSIQVVRQRYQTLPSVKGSATIFMEVDLISRTAGESLFGLHLSCSPAPVKSNAVSVRTQSGIVPELPNEACVTIIIIVEVEDIVLSEESDESPLGLTIEAHWTTGREAHNIACDRSTRRASQVALLQLPLESLLLVRQGWTCFEYSLPGSTLVPSAVYECRKPRRLEVDVSYCTSCDWAAWAESLNTMLKGTGHHIDVCIGEGRVSILSIALFAFPAEDLPGMFFNITHACLCFLVLSRVAPYRCCCSREEESTGLGKSIKTQRFIVRLYFLSAGMGCDRRGSRAKRCIRSDDSNERTKGRPPNLYNRGRDFDASIDAATRRALDHLVVASSLRQPWPINSRRFPKFSLWIRSKK
jgi:hypothetical protein